MKIFVSPGSLDQSLLQEQSGIILAPFPGTSVNLSEGQGVQAGGGMREFPTANLIVVGFKLLLEW